MKTFIKLLVEKVTGYWFYKIDYLPIGSDFKVDILKRFKHHPFQLIFDVGANIGQTHKQFRRMFPKSKVYCFEPIVGAYNKLKANIDKDRLTITENIAFGETSGEKIVKLYEDWDVLNSLKEELMNKAANATSQKVIINTIDNYCKNLSLEKIDLLKIDTEGYEMNVLSGASEMLKARRISFILCEVGFLKVNHRNTNFSELSEYLARFGYYFIGLYNLSGEGWSSGQYYGNALYANKFILKLR
jgi:FkbM family methyltransferase